MSEILDHHRLFCEYSLVFKGNTPRTVKWLEETMRYFLKHTNVKTVHEINRPLIENYILRGKLDRGWSAKTIRTRISSIKLFLDWCVRQEIIEKNPAKEIDLPKLPQTLPRHLTKDQALTLLEWTRGFRYSYKFERVRAIAIMSTFIFTGIRLQELLNLKIEDVRFDDRDLLIRSGKGNKDRLIPLNHDLLVALKNYMKDRDRLKRHNPQLFVSLVADKPMKYESVKRLVERLRTKSKIHFTPHMLRHTFATLMLEGGADIFAISKMLGHSDIKTTTIYLSATTAHLKSEVEKHPLSSIANLRH